MENSKASLARYRRLLQALAVCLAALLLLPAGCKRDGDGNDTPEGTTPHSNELPKLELRDDTKNLLLTYYNDKGDFIVKNKIADVPEASRAEVRVVVTTSDNGTGELFYVADLRKKNADGTYPIKNMTRAAWDEKGAKLREARMEKLAPSASAPPVASDSAPPADSAKPAPTKAARRLVAIIYGASWCKPCHDAQRYLSQRGVTVIYKDVDASEVAQQEMQRKLERYNMAGASIPVIDIGGRLMVGFSPSALDKAIQATDNTQTL